MVLPRNIEMSAQLCIEQHIREIRHQELSYHNLTNRLNQVLCYSSGLKDRSCLPKQILYTVSGA